MSRPAASMPANCQFNPAARAEYDDAIRHYVTVTDGPQVATRFVAAVESALAAISAAPEMWRVVDPPDLRRYVIRRFPYVLYYRYQSGEGSVVIYAISHTSRQPNYWRGRLPRS